MRVVVAAILEVQGSLFRQSFESASAIDYTEDNSLWDGVLETEGELQGVSNLSRAFDGCGNTQRLM